VRSLNKRGIDYALLLWVIVAIGVIMLYVNLQDRVTRTGLVGEVEIPILRSEAERLYFDNFIKNAAQISIVGAMEDIASTSYGLLTVGDCVILNTETKLTTLNLPKVVNAATGAFNTRMNNYLKEYQSKTDQQIPISNYELYFTKGKVSGIAIIPIVMPIKDFTGGTIGKFSYHPNFEIKYAHEIEQYMDTFEILELIADKCAKSKDAMKCISEYESATKTWTIEKQGDMLTFVVPHRPESSCYALILPKSSPA